MASAVLTENELEALSHWSVGSIAKAELAESGTINRTILLETITGLYALRVCRATKTTQAAQQECDVIKFVAQQGLPALAPIDLPNGEPFLILNHQHYLLFPKARGLQTARPLLKPWQLEKMGECLAHLTLALEDYSTRDIYRRSFVFDLSATLARLSELEQRIKTFPQFGPDEEAALERVYKQRAFLETHEPTANLENLHFQVSHGDFHDGNLFFENGEISAIIDWDQLRVVPRYFELLRTTHFLLSELKPSNVRRFVEAFIKHYPVDKKELSATIRLYSTERAYNLWLLETIYLEGNERARVFLRGRFADSFTPFKEIWQSLKVKI
jgi:homoserine kinase type II